MNHFRPLTFFYSLLHISEARIALWNVNDDFKRLNGLVMNRWNVSLTRSQTCSHLFGGWSVLKRTSNVLEAFNFNDLYDNCFKLCWNRHMQDRNTTEKICNIVQSPFSPVTSVHFLTMCKINHSYSVRFMSQKFDHAVAHL